MRHQRLVGALLLALMIGLAVAGDATDANTDNEADDETSIQYKQRHHHHKHHRRVNPPACTHGLTYCHLTRTCVSLTTDSKNCGTCGNVCGTNDTCVASACRNCPAFNGNYTAPLQFNCSAASTAAFDVYVGGGVAPRDGGCIDNKRICQERCPVLVRDIVCRRERNGNTDNTDGRIPVGEWVFTLSYTPPSTGPFSIFVMDGGTGDVLFPIPQRSATTKDVHIMDGPFTLPAPPTGMIHVNVTSSGPYAVGITSAEYTCPCNCCR